MIVYPILQVIRQQARKHGHRKFERTASPQMLAQPADGTGQVFLDGRLGDAQPRGDFAVFQPFEAAHPENLAAAVGQLRDGFGDQHHSQPRALYISQCTELGTIYTPEELKRLTDFAHLNGMYVHMDGARIANACAALHLSLKELTVDCGIDILSFGGTKNGLMMGECVIIFNKDLQREARYVRKQSAQLASKMRYLSCQFTAYLTDDLWLKNAAHANAMAGKLYQALKELPEVTFTQKPESNQLFLTMPRPAIDRMLEFYFFYFWNEANNEIRLVTSFDTTEEDVNQFIRLLRR